MKGEYEEILALCDRVDALQVGLASAMVEIFKAENPLEHQDEIVACHRGFIALAEAQGALKAAAKHIEEGGN